MVRGRRRRDLPQQLCKLVGLLQSIRLRQFDEPTVLNLLRLARNVVETHVRRKKMTVVEGVEVHRRKLKSLRLLAHLIHREEMLLLRKVNVLQELNVFLAFLQAVH